jgi:hypothetical protein
VSEKDIRKQIIFCRKLILQRKKEYADKKQFTKKEIEDNFNTKINEIKSKIKALTKSDDKSVAGSTKKKEKSKLLKSLKSEIRAISKKKSSTLKEKLNEIDKEKKTQIKKLKGEMKGLQTMLNTLKRSKIPSRYV